MNLTRFRDANAGGDEPVTEWLRALAGRDEVAAQRLWERYCRALMDLARDRFGTLRRPAYDEEDAALSAFHSFCRGVMAGRFPKLDDRQDLWSLLVTITARKVTARRRYETGAKRGGGEVKTLPLSPPARPGADDPAAPPDPAPTPEMAAIFAEECERLLGALEEGKMRQIALLRLEGWTVEEIAARLGCTQRAVYLKLERIRERWERHGRGPGAGAEG